MNYFNDLLAVRCETEKKGKLTYVSWIEAWVRLKGIHPGATYAVRRNEHGGFLHGEGFVEVEVTVPGALEGGGDVTHGMWLPVMNERNAQIKEPSSTDINKAVMRCLAKAVAMHGLGSYVYLGEDLPVIPPAEPARPPAPAAMDYQGKLREIQTWAGEPRTAAKIEAMRAKVSGWGEPWGDMAREVLSAVEVAP